jgi:hypothetical protein
MLNIKCPECGSYNDDHAVECYFCHTPLAGSSRNSSPMRISSGSQAGRQETRRYRASSRKRPGCLSLLALSYILPNALTIVGLFLLALFFLEPASFNNIINIVDPSLQTQANTLTMDAMAIGILYLLCIPAGVCGFGLILGVGLWQMKNWARILMMFFQGAGLLFQFAAIPIYLLSLQDYFLPVITVVIGIIFNFIILQWFMFNRAVFD